MWSYEYCIKKANTTSLQVLQEYAIPYTRLADEVTLDQAVWVAGSASFSAAVCRDSRQSRVVFKTHGIRFVHTW